MNKNLVVVLVVVLAVGFFMCRRSTPVATPADAVGEEVEVLPEKPVAKTPPLVDEKKGASVPEPLILEVQKESKEATRKFEEPSDEMEAGIQRRELQLSQSMIEEMETHWDHLSSQIRVNRESRGWRVMQVGPGSLFEQVGFQKNDLITNEIVESLRDQTDSEDLPERFSALLDHAQIP